MLVTSHSFYYRRRLCEREKWWYILHMCIWCNNVFHMHFNPTFFFYFKASCEWSIRFSPVPTYVPLSNCFEIFFNNISSTPSPTEVSLMLIMKLSGKESRPEFLIDVCWYSILSVITDSQYVLIPELRLATVHCRVSVAFGGLLEHWTSPVGRLMSWIRGDKWFAPAGR